MILRSICKNAIDGDSFVGIKYSEGKPEIFFPMSYSIPNDGQELQKAIFSLIRTIYISKTCDKDIVNSNKGNPKTDFPIYAFLWLLNDFLNNGLYSSRDVELRKNSNGKINWKRTLKLNPVFSENGVVFLNIVTTRHVDINDFITKVQIKCLNIANSVIGFIFGNISIPKDDLILSDKYILSVLKKERFNTFVDRKKHLINQLINVLTDTSNDVSINILRTFGTYKFNTVWEQIINKMFGNIDDISKFYPGTYYVLENEYCNKRINNSKLRPDTIMDFDEKHHILDAKYYSFETKNNLPASSDIQKQITYADYMDKVLKDGKKIYNAFIIPYDFSSLKEESLEKIKYIGYGESEWRNGERKSHDRISLIILDMRFALECFSKYRSRINIEILSKEITKNNA